MKSAIAVLLTSVSFVSARSVSGSVGRDPHPVEKVIGLLKELKVKVIEEGQTEEVTFAKFDKWCSDSKKTLQKSVSESKESIDSLEDEVASKEAENTTLTEQLSKLADEIEKYESAQTDGDEARKSASEAYTKADTDFESTIKAFTDAITALKDAKPAAALVQELLGKVPAMALGSFSDHQMSLLMATAEPEKGERPDMLAKGDYGKHTKKYSFKSNNVVELLKELKANFEDKRVEATKAETNAANAHELAKDARAKALEAAKSAQKEKTTELGDCKEALNTAQGSLTDAKGDLKADSTSLDDTKRQCRMKKEEWDERSSIRAKEVEAIEAGVKILAKVTGVRTEAPENPGMPAKPADAPAEEKEGGAFLAIDVTVDPRLRAVNLLRSEATRLHSKAFQRFAAEVEAKANGPFDEVNNMIQKMIFRLQAEQKDDDDHKNWCDLELEKTNSSVKDKEDKLEELGLKISEAKSSTALLTQEIQDANNMVAKIDEFVTEATEVRNTGKKENKAAIGDAKAAQEALAKAVAVLEEFYKDSGMVKKESWEFVQKGSEPVTLPEEPSSWDASYTGVADPKKQPGGILTVLETIATDFSKMQAETMAQEATDERNYQEEMKDQKIEKARRSKEAEMKTQQKQQLVEKSQVLAKNEKHTKDEKAANEQYLKDLEPACVEGDSTYEDRKAARGDEIAALKESQVILSKAFDEKGEEKTMFLEAQPPSSASSFLAPVRPAQ